MKDKFVKISNAYRVLSDPERREKYDLYGIADDQGFKNFDEAFKNAHDVVEDSWLNWVGLLLMLGAGIIPIFIAQRNRAKPAKKKREVFLSMVNRTFFY
jgi:DnaJ-class molecular chaperone